MVKNDSQSVPERYIQEHKNRPLVSEIFPAASLQIPIIDFSLLAEGDEHERRKLDLACKEWGFFHLSLSCQSKRKRSMQWVMAANDLQGYGQAYVVSEQQKLDWCDLMFLMTLPTENRNFKFWPLSLRSFKEAVEVYSKEIQMVAEELYANLSLLMGMNRDGLKMLQGELKQAIRMNYYPACSRPDLVLGVSPHSDGSALTLLLQDDEIIGLQIKNKEEWIPVKPITNSLVVNLGDAVEILSNGMYKSIEHRAITNEMKARISIATFAFLDDELEIGPLDSIVDDQHRPRMYQKVKYVDYIRQVLARKMDEKALTDLLKIQNK
ncbi:hypothetical protein DITRI_Ditri09bG0142600 [Diplodiscus trichospermus]